MVPLTEQAHQLVRTVVQPGETVVDATAGNGFDTVFLADLVGPSGKVIACDIQERAIKSTRQKLSQAGVNHVRLIRECHAILLGQLLDQYAGGVAAVMFNLGYLPRGMKEITTQSTSTLAAITSAVELLRPAGIMTIIAYSGHLGGDLEAAAVENILQEFLDSGRLESLWWPSTSSGSLGPRLYCVSRRFDRSATDSGSSTSLDF